MLPLRVAIVWHQHQPYYKKDGEFILPWVRLHGVKDYYDLPALLAEYPAVKQTFNLAPSLLLQVQDYVERNAHDAVEVHTLLNAEELSSEQKQFIRDNFFLCNVDRMILPYERYRDLYERMHKSTELDVFSAGDWRDLQMWYNLTWIGPMCRRRSDVQVFFERGRDFTEEDKSALLAIHRRILAKVVPVLRSVLTSGQVELSVTPAYHPILPLLCDSTSASEAMPNAALPRTHFCYPQDAEYQVQRGREIFANAIGSLPVGLWPAEGSISTEALAVVARAGFRWSASDEHILERSLPDYRHVDKYYPYTFCADSGEELGLLFRDHVLSDLIGFVYSSWNPADAAANFCERLKDIRTTLIAEHGEEALHTAVVPIILDGENCWEYYADNGEPFLRELFRLLGATPELTTVTGTEAVNVERRAVLRRVHAGSWINANFSIWIGHDEDNEAWDVLGRARADIERVKEQCTPQQYAEAREMISIAEGSDWFWWYGDDHESANDDVFDSLFRWYVEQAYRAAGLDVPERVFKPIATSGREHVIVQPVRAIAPVVNGRALSEADWEGAGYYDAALAGGAMHHGVDIFRRLWFGRNGDTVYFRCDTNRPLDADEMIRLEFVAPVSVAIEYSPRLLSVESEEPLRIGKMTFALDEVMELAFPAALIGADTHEFIEVRVRVVSHHAEQLYPVSGSLSVGLADVIANAEVGTEAG